MKFEWDRKKALANEQKHAVTFEEATEVFGDDLSATVQDPDHSINEARFIIFGQSISGRHLVVAHTERDDRVRIISARQMTRQERQAYES